MTWVRSHDRKMSKNIYQNNWLLQNHSSCTEFEIRIWQHTRLMRDRVSLNHSIIRHMNRQYIRTHRKLVIIVVYCTVIIDNVIYLNSKRTKQLASTAESKLINIIPMSCTNPILEDRTLIDASFRLNVEHSQEPKSNMSI